MGPQNFKTGDSTRRSSTKASSGENAEVYETFTEAFLVLDKNLRYLFANAAYKTLIDKANQVLRGASFLDIHPGAHDSTMIKLLKTLEQEDCAGTYEDYNIQLKKWLEYHINPHDRGFTISVNDVTERKAHQLATERREEQVRFVFEQSPIGMARLGLDGRWLSVNSRCADIIGASKEKLVGSSFKDICLPHTHFAEQEAFASLLRHERTELNSEKQIVRLDGSVIWVQLRVSLVMGLNRKPRFFLVIMEDIAERKEIEESLQFALDAAQMGTWDFDAINNSTRSSARFDEIFGYKNIVRNWTYQDFLSHVFSEDSELAEKTFRDALLSGHNFALECRIVWPDSSIRWISLRGRVYLNHQGRAVQMAGTVMDITEQKHREEDLKKAREAAEEANREKSNFLANMSHEIRTPLGAILGFTDMLTDPNLKKEEYQEYLKIILRNGKSLAVLVDDILDLSKVEAGHLDVEQIPVDIWELIENIGTLFRMRAESKGLKLNITSTGFIPTWLKTDPARLRQILLNIVGNAIKFTDHGDVSVNLKSITLGGRPQLAFMVKDTGPGITSDQTARLFQPFTQADSSTTRKFGGTGLGLALSRRWARALGGDVILYKSRPGVGSAFLITVDAEEVSDHALSARTELSSRTSLFDAGLDDFTNVESPLVKASSLTKNSATPSDQAVPQPKAATTTVQNVGPVTNTIAPNPAGALDGLQILVADDSADNRLLISRILNKGGATTDLADDGNIAVEKARRNSYDVVVMDMQMPNLDGYGATRQLREDGFLGPIVALTANAMRNDRERCLEAGCSDYLAKPIDPVQLYRVLGNLTHSHA